MHAVSDGTQWTDWMGWVDQLTVRTLTPVSAVSAFRDSHYGQNCNPFHTSADHDHYHIHSHHMEQAWNATIAYEQLHGFQYDYVLKTRCDLHFHPKQYFQSCYIDGLGDRTLLSPDLEFFCENRWNERGPGLGEGAGFCRGAELPFAQTTFPEWMPDLFFFGRRLPMSVALTIDSAPMVMPCWNKEYVGREKYDSNKDLWKQIGNAERLLAEHVYSHDIAVYTVPLQLGRAMERQNWNTRPCLLCYACTPSL